MLSVAIVPGGWRKYSWQYLAGRDFFPCWVLEYVARWWPLHGSLWNRPDSPPRKHESSKSSCTIILLYRLTCLVWCQENTGKVRRKVRCPWSFRTETGKLQRIQRSRLLFRASREMSWNVKFNLCKASSSPLVLLWQNKEREGENKYDFELFGTCSRVNIISTRISISNNFWPSLRATALKLVTQYGLERRLMKTFQNCNTNAIFIL